MMSDSLPQHPFREIHASQSWFPVSVAKPNKTSSITDTRRSVNYLLGLVVCQHKFNPTRGQEVLRLRTLLASFDKAVNEGRNRTFPTENFGVKL